MLSFTLLGQTVLSKNGVPLTKFRSQKEAALLIYLAHTGQTYQRDFIAELLWESSSTKQALTNLRTALTRLKKQVGEALVITRKSLALTPESQQQVDSVKLLETLTAVAQIDSPENAAALQKALETYRGDFLDDFHLANAPRFEKWIITTRENIRRQVVAGYEKLGKFARSTGNIEYGIAIAHQWLQFDALDETAHTLLIQMQIKQGNVREAVAQYTKAAKLLKTELDIEPPAEMTALIRHVQPSPAGMTRPTAIVRHNLPPVYDQLFGRKTAQKEIQMRLDQPWCRMVTITGQGGVGKTRLATTVARSRLSQYRDGVWLVALADLDADDDDLAEAIAVEIATVVDMRLNGSATPIEQLLNHLQHKQMMLVLDNFEHLLGGVQIVLDLLQRCEQVQIVVTSREALRIRAEWSIALTGLSYPNSDKDEMSSDAVTMFTARQAQQRRGEITEDEMAAVRTICHMVQGLPLAIELAAALTRHATPQTIANNLRDGFDTLTTTLRDVPERHRGLSMVFEMSWRELSPALQVCLARMSVFRGGFMETAVSHIAQATPQHLTTLIEKSLLTLNAETNRYTLHPVIRTYAANKRFSNDPTPRQHTRYFLTLLAQNSEPLQKEKPQASMAVLEPDIENVRRAWQRGVEQREAELLANALTSLSLYYQLRGLAHEGESVMHSTMSAAMAWGSDGIPLATRAGLERARFQNRLGQYRPAMQTIQAVLKLADAYDDSWAAGMAHVWWGESLWRQGDYNAAKEKLTHAFDIGKADDVTLIIGWCHHQLGIVNDIQGHFHTARDHLEKACTAWRALNNTNTLSISLNSLGIVYKNLGDLPAAQQTLEQCLTLCSQIGNRHLQSFLLNNLSIITTNLGDYMGAQYYIQLGLELASSTGNLTGQGQLYTNLGRTYLLLGELDLSVESLEKGLQIAESLGDHSVIAAALLNLADAKKAQGKLEQASSLLDQALALTQKSNLLSIECSVLMSLAELLSKNDVNQAQKYSLQAMSLAERIQSPDLLERAKTINQKLLAADAGNEKNLSA